ncbi:hypothetical protein [Actinoplanes xinjiangensis]|uniref:hypothetical protein n=1 Tax=Actinoplanes xinjiangensis TaxID=512350 RepID=UPI0011B817D8|nr:hypothetical protein [Actinoplanes xinjiangensis]
MALRAATASLAVGVTTPVRSGSNCRSGCVPYPYTDAAAFVPRDYLWMSPAVLAALSFVVLAVCVHDQTRRQGRSLSLVGALLTGLGRALSLWLISSTSPSCNRHRFMARSKAWHCCRSTTHMVSSSVPHAEDRWPSSGGREQG